MRTKVAEEKRIPMKDFPLKPGDLVIMPLNHIVEDERPFIGKCFTIYSRNPDPGVTISIATKEDFDAHVGGIHASVKLSYEDSMWALIVFATHEGPVSKVFHTYELVDMLEHNEIAVLGEDANGFFDNHFNILLHST